MFNVSAKELHNATSSVLDRVERGETVTVTRNGNVIGCIKPAKAPKKATWNDVMAEVFEAHKRIKPHEVQPNPVLAERARRRR